MSTMTAEIIEQARRAVTETSSDAQPRRSQATVLVDLALKAGAELWHTPDGDPYTTVPVAEHFEHHRLRGLRDWLGRLHHQRTGRTASSQAIAEALTTLGGMAKFDGAEYPVDVRVAGQTDAVYLDLGDAAWRAVEITADGWRLVTNPPVRFRRSRALLALPAPARGGSVDALRELIHVSDEDWPLLVGFVLGALRPQGPFPVLALDGEQGAGKSTTARMLRRLIDPSTAELRAEPREIRDLMIAAAGGRIVALDNLSKLQPWLSDALCRLSTGGALSTRALWTDDDEHVIEAMRPCIVTGIASVLTRGDLVDRAITLTLPALTETGRKREASLWTQSGQLWPGVLGALLDAVALCVRRENDVQLASLPRMADWSIWVTAGAPALGWPEDRIIGAYRARYQDAIETSLDGDPVAIALRALATPWKGTSSELLATLTRPDPVPEDWPRSPRGLSAVLRRLAPLLRRVGCDIVLPDKARTARERIIRIETIGTGQDKQDSPGRRPVRFVRCVLFSPSCFCGRPGSRQGSARAAVIICLWCGEPSTDDHQCQRQEPGEEDEYRG